jgi:N-acylneuraminate cytidylyltransferase
MIGNTIAFIPVRGGSKSIPLKNIKLINGKPLVCWVLDAALNCREIDKVVVSTDSDEIREIAGRYTTDKIMTIDRSEKVSTDIASTESVMLEFAEKYSFQNMILIQATSPLLRSEDLFNGIGKFNQKGIDSVLSVVRQKRFLWSNSSQGAKAINYDPLNRPRRQDFEGLYVENGAFYITSRERLLDTKCRISGKIDLVEMAEETYFEIDEASDWKIVEGLLKESLDTKKRLEEKVSRLKCLLSDCDGVLTDGGMYYSEKGDELKKFNTKDGMGLRFIQENGFITGIITGEKIDLVRRRAEKMRVNELYCGVRNKMEVLDKICEKYNLEYEEIAYIGDDINDLEVLENVGLACTVNDGMDCIKEVADYITCVNGGRGAVREVVELILDLRNRKK